MNFSICLIAKNEENTLPKMASSLKEYQSLGGEVILLDTGSTDKTTEVARGLGFIVQEVGDKFRINIDKKLSYDINKKFVVANEQPVVKEGDNMFDFASARNYCAELAANDMVAAPDCDEMYTKFDLDKIQEAITNGAEQLEYNFVFSHDANGNPVIKFRHCKFYNRKKLKWEGIIHEVLVGSANKVFLGEDVIKLEHWQNVSTNRSGYMKGLALDCYNHPENDRNSHYMARELMYSGRFKSAIKEFERHIAMNRWEQENAQSILYVGDCHASMGDMDEAFKWWAKSIEKCGDKREPWMRFAEHYYKLGKAQQVISYCEAALTIPQAPFYSNYQPYYEHYPHELLYWSYWQVGDKKKSKENYDKAVAFSPSNPKYLSDRKFYYDALPKVSILIPTLNRPEGLQRCLDSIKKLNYPQDRIQVMMDKGEGTVPRKVAQMLEQADGEYICYAADDMEFTPNSLLIAVEESKQMGKGMVSFNAGAVYPDKGNICEHFIIRKDFIKEIGGEIFDTEFTHVGVDNLLWAQCDKLGQAYHSEKALINHYHFSKGAEFDATYKKAWESESVQKDRELLKLKLSQL